MVSSVQHNRPESVITKSDSMIGRNDGQVTVKQEPHWLNSEVPPNTGYPSNMNYITRAVDLFPVEVDIESKSAVPLTKKLRFLFLKKEKFSYYFIPI